MRFVKPLDKILLKKLALTHEFFVTIEDNVIAGGAGSAVNEFILSEKLKVKVKNIGLPDKFLPHGTREEILDLGGLSSKNIKKEIKEFVN
jgi:1-deoxy-D-xylulose-5-phosphate synthase